MAQKKLVQVEFSEIQDLEKLIETGGRYYQDITNLIGEIDKQLSLLEGRINIGFKTTEKINDLGSKIDSQAQKLGVATKDIPVIGKANVFLDQYAKLETKAKKYLK